MSLLDIVLIILLLTYALSGYIQGFVVNLAATVGLLSGGLLAIALVPTLLDSMASQLTTSLIALAAVLVSAGVGQAVGTQIGSRVRGDRRRGALTQLDAVGGAALSMVAVLAASWALGYSISGTQIPLISSAVRGSSILSTVNEAMPSQASDVLRSFNRTLDSSLFPRYLEPFANEQITAVAPPDPTVLQNPEIRAAASSVVKITGLARCDRGIEGSGFYYAPGRVMTNAHVVAGVSQPTVQVAGREVQAQVVLFDPDLDVAVLSTPDVGVASLSFNRAGQAGQDAAVLGFPQNGPFDARAARIRSKIRLQSPDIYDRGETTRESFAVRSLVRSGNSGGPLISTDGDVLGVVFAASITDTSTGYVLTADQVQDSARAGQEAQSAVSTGGCA